MLRFFQLITLQSERIYSVFSADFSGEWLRNVKILHSVQQTQFFLKKARILRKVVIDTTDSLAEGISCRQPTAVPLRQKIPPAKREQTKNGSQYFSAQKPARRARAKTKKSRLTAEPAPVSSPSRNVRKNPVGKIHEYV